MKLNAGLFLEGVTPLWHTNYYDGPLEGYAMYNDTLHYFECDYGGHLFNLCSITPAEERYALYVHAWFTHLLGTHTTYGADGSTGRVFYNLKSIQKFYEMFPADGHDHKFYRVHLGVFKWPWWDYNKIGEIDG